MHRGHTAPVMFYAESKVKPLAQRLGRNVGHCYVEMKIVGAIFQTFLRIEPGHFADVEIGIVKSEYFHIPCSVMTKNQGRMDSIKSLVQEYRPQCVIELTWQACITYDVESHLVRELVENELNLPYLRIETDYSPSDTERIALRVQALFETINK